MTSEFQEQVSAYGAECKAKLAGPGELEALISGPISNLLSSIGSAIGSPVVAHDEVREMGGALRADFAVSVKQVLTGHVELKAPGTSLDPSTYAKSSHNFQQWRRLKELPNLLHTNGFEWRLWRSGELVRGPVYFGGVSVFESGRLLTCGPDFGSMIRDFLSWEPLPITRVAKLVTHVAPLSRALREEVVLALQAERRAIKSGADPEMQPFLGALESWKRLLLPVSKDRDFADGYAQTVTFALLLAQAEGVDLKESSIHDVSKELDASHSLMGRALDLLTQHAEGPVHTGVELLKRVISAVQWDALSKGSKDVYLHLYEDFLEYYDPELREKTGSYYTPPEVVNEMVRLTEEALRTYFGKRRAFRDPSVAVVDGSMGTGTYPLSILERAANQAEEEYGPAAAPEALTSLAQRLYGLELQSAPFSVAELRITSAIRKAGADLPSGGLNLYVADTLESPWAAAHAQLSYSEQLIAQQRRRANTMKRERTVQVVISNPPYEERASGMGSWIENGDITHDPSFIPLADFKYPGNGRHEGLALKNLYVYFWRWAMWKVFESTPASMEMPEGDSGVICYITANGYLTGPGFKGMRKRLREQCSHGWIIDVTPEGKRPPSGHAIFNIETPVCIAIFLRMPGTVADIPAEIKYVAFHGSYEQKMAQLATLTLDDERLLAVRSDWTAPFTPAAAETWDHWPALGDILPWASTGVTSNRGWVYAPHPSILEYRFRALVQESDPSRKSELLKATVDSTIYKTKKPLPHVNILGSKDTEQGTNIPLHDVDFISDLKTVRLAYRSFDRQYISADSRVLDRPRAPLWHARSIPGQIFIVEQHSHHPKSGPGLMFSNLMPDQHSFNNRGGRALPIFHPDGEPNFAPGFLVNYSRLLGTQVSPEDFTAYLAGVVSHPDFVKRFTEELVTPGIRVPLTNDIALWKEAVSLGREVLWLHSFGALCQEEGSRGEDVRDTPNTKHPHYLKQVKNLPDIKSYDSETLTLHIGEGSFGPVDPQVISYEVGGMNVLNQWFGYRKASPNQKVTSPLDQINAPAWEHEWSLELLEILSVLTQLLPLHDKQKNLLERILESPMAVIDDFTEVSWPTSSKDRAPHSADPKIF